MKSNSALTRVSQPTSNVNVQYSVGSLLAFFFCILMSTAHYKGHKYPKGPPYNVYGFPQVISTYATAHKRAVELYTRSLLLEGHGYPVFYPYGVLSPRDPSVHKPVTVGDVGMVNEKGYFKWLFNIFLPADKPTQRKAPDGFQPFTPPPSESEITCTPQFHKPGTIIVSPGVTVDVRSKEPWDVNFTTAEKQAGVLILQGGADRHELISTERYHEYIAKNAQHWYQIANNFGEATYPNGSLLVVTGYNSCDRFSHVQYAPDYAQPVMNLTFTQPLGTTHGDWRTPRTFNHNLSVGWPHPPEFESKAVDGHLTVFVRGIRVSVSGDSWRNSIPRLGFSPHNRHCTVVTSPPTKSQLWLEKARVKLRIGRREDEMLEDFASLLESIFQPNFMIGQILLGQYPEASVALVEDQIWSSYVEKGRPCTLPELNKLITRMFASCHIVEYRGIIKLVPKQQDTSRQRLPDERILTPPPSWARRREDDNWVAHVPLAKWPRL